MINKETLKFYLFEDTNCERTLTELGEALSKSGDYLTIEHHSFNSGGFLTFESSDYDEEREEIVTDNGDLYIDKDSFNDNFKYIVEKLEQ